MGRQRFVSMLQEFRRYRTYVAEHDYVVAGGKALVYVSSLRADSAGQFCSAYVRGCDSANGCNVENASAQMRVLLHQRNRHHTGAARDIQQFAVLRKIEIARQRLRISLVQVEQHLGEVFGLARVPLHTFQVIGLGEALDLVMSFARRKGLFQDSEPLVGGHALPRVLPSPIDGALVDEVLLRKPRVPVEVILFVQQSQRDHRVEKGHPIQPVQFQGFPDLRGGHAFVVQCTKQLQPLRSDDQAGKDEGFLYVDFRKDAFGELVEGRQFHRDRLGWSWRPATSMPRDLGSRNFNSNAPQRHLTHGVDWVDTRFL